MARARDWDALGDRQRKRYLSAGGRQGMTPDDVRQYYLSGGDLTAWRGKKTHPGFTSSQWDRLIRLGKDARWTEAREGIPLPEALEDLRRKGFDYSWIAERLREKKESRDYYSRLSHQQRRGQGDHGPGTDRFARRPPHANVELFFYH